MRTVFVDIWDTLVANPKNNPVQQIREQYFKEEAYDTVRNAIMDSQLFTTEIDSVVAWTNILQQLQGEPAPETVIDCKEIWDRTNDNATLIPGALEFLDSLRENGNRVILATAIDNHSFSMLNEKFGLREHVDDIAPTFIVGQTKSEGYYRELCSRFNVNPEDAIMVGDSIDRDAIPATKAGLHTTMIRHTPLNHELAVFVPHQTIVCSSYEEILYAITHDKV